jgi:hypothetical protein
MFSVNKLLSTCRADVLLHRGIIMGMSRERDSKNRIAFVQLFAEASSSTAVPDEIHVVPTGKWDHPVYGEMEITPADISEFVQNFSRGVRLDIPITAGHDNGMSGGELPAIGWFTELSDRGQSGLYASVKCTDEGKQLLTSGSFKYFSPEFYEQYSDPESGIKYGHTLVGGALTNKPYFKELDPVVAFSEPDIRNQFIDDMNLKDILAKKASELSNTEKSFLREHKSELNAEQTTAFASVFDESASRMREIRPSGLMSGDGKRSDANRPQATAPFLDSTFLSSEFDVRLLDHACPFFHFGCHECAELSRSVFAKLGVKLLEARDDVRLAKDCVEPGVELLDDLG